MISRHSLTIILLLFLSMPAFGASGSVTPIPATPANYVVDQADILSPQVEGKLNLFLKELEQKTTAQVVVLTVQSLEGGSIDDLSLQVAERWRLGQKGKDNGLLLLFAMQERRYRIEVGYGLEGMLPDSLVGSIGREFIVPYFKRGEYGNGVTAATLAVAGVIAKEAGVTITGMPRISASPRGSSRPQVSKKPTIMGTIFTILFIIFMGYMFIRHPRLMIMMLLLSSMGGRRGSWGGGGGFGGGGFGGGGGGGFGGGGAAGGW